MRLLLISDTHGKLGIINELASDVRTLGYFALVYASTNYSKWKRLMTQNFLLTLITQDLSRICRKFCRTDAKQSRAT